MVKPILGILLGGLLILGFSPAFAEEPLLSDEQILQAWNQTPTQVEPLMEAATPTRTEGLQMLTDDELDKINAAGLEGLGGIAAHKAVLYGCSLLCGPIGAVKNHLLGLKQNGTDPS